MYFNIQELRTRKEVKGSAQKIILGTENIDGYLFNTYEFSIERFIRPIKKAYRITLHESYGEDEKQYIIATLNYYDIAESIADDTCDDEDTLHYRLFKKIEAIIAKFNIPDDKKDEFVDEIYDTFTLKIAPLFEQIIEEFAQTEEGKTFLKHKRIIQKYNDNKQKFISENDALGQEYDICYDLYGNLTNKDYFDKIQRRNSDYQKEENNNHNNYSDSPNVFYTEEQRKILKQFYGVLEKSFHSDANAGRNTSEQTKLLNKLKEDWGL